MVGDGPDSKVYKNLVKDKDLNDVVIFLGAKQNPYPYFKISDCVVLTSDYEGYPVVFIESYLFNKPIITTKVSDYEDIENRCGLVTEKDVKDIYEKMKSFIDDGYEIKSSFNPEDYNKKILDKIEKLF